MNKKIRLVGLIFLISCIFHSAFSQKKDKTLTLKDVIILAEVQSRDAVAAKNKFQASYWEYRNFRTQYLPMLKLNTTLPSFNRSIVKYTNESGKDVFIQQRVADYSASMSLSKTIGLTGGQLFLKSGLQRIDNITDSTTTSQYLSNPITIGFSQPILAYNPYRWDNKIQPLKYNEAQNQYVEDIEQVHVNAINYFFDYLQAELALKIATTNAANYDTLYKIAKGRYNLGKIAENELLQLELSYLKASSGVESSRLELENSIFKLKSFLRLPENEEIKLIPPANGFPLKVDVQKALAEAKTNRSDVYGFQRRLFEAESQVHQARLENRFNANLYAEYGLTQSASEIKDAYNKPQDQQLITFGIQIPILDWGLAKGKIRMAESNRDMIRINVEQQQIDFEQEVFLKVMQFNMQQNQLFIAAKSDTVAQKRYFVTKQRYLIGKIDITDLNIAQNETDEAQLGFINSLRSFWRSYYDLRRLTLFDFQENHIIEANYENLMK